MCCSLWWISGVAIRWACFPNHAGPFTETIDDVVPTMLDWVGLEVPRSCDGASLLPFLHGATPADWRTEVHYEYDCRGSYAEIHDKVLGLHVDQCSLAAIQDAHDQYVHFDALPPLFFDLQAAPGQFYNRA